MDPEKWEPSCAHWVQQPLGERGQQTAVPRSEMGSARGWVGEGESTIQLLRKAALPCQKLLYGSGLTSLGLSG